MPPRWLCLAIAAFWLSTVGYLVVWPELRNRFLSDDAPPITIDLLDESLEGRNRISWQVEHNGRDSHKAESVVVHHPADDTFEMTVTLTERLRRPDDPPRGRAEVGLTHVKSTHIVTREGALVRTSLSAALEVAFLGDVFIDFDGAVRGGRFFSHYSLRGTGRTLQGELEPVDVSERGSMLNPLHPLRRVQNVRPGQRWRLRLVDPTGDAVAGLAARFGVESRSPLLDAHVLPEPRVLVWEKRELSCLVIEYHEGDELRARTWVEQSTGLVLRQEAEQGGSSWVFTRTTPIDGL